MSQQEMKNETMNDNDNDNDNNNNIDTSQVYCTNAIIIKVGRAIAVDLNSCMLPGNTKNKHMTIMFRSGKRWTNDEIELVSKETDNWIKTKYGSNKAPVTFTIENWGKKSVKIIGDLNELCLHLRLTFNSMTNDSQRDPHVELFTNRGGRGGKNKGNYKRGGGNYKNGKKGKNGGNKSEKITEKLGRMIYKMQELKSKKQKEVQLLDEQEKQLQELLDNADNLDIKTLRNEIKNIAKTFKNKRKEMKINNKRGGRRKFGKKGGRKKSRNSFKKDKKDKKEQKKLDKQERKELNKLRKQQRKEAKAEKQRLKKEKIAKLARARLESLPCLADIDDDYNSRLSIYVDGYNIIGCDSICRKNMRGRGGGMKKSRSRLSKLLQERFLNKVKNNQIKLDYNVIMKLWFDGNGKNEQYQDIEITFSTKKQIVDDKLVELLSKNNKKQNSAILVITTDKELTLRLHEIGVKVMKSSTFYKTFLKDNEENDNNNTLVDDEKKSEELDEEDFVQVMAKKLNYGQLSDEETPKGYGENTDDESDYTPDEVEGANDDGDGEETGDDNDEQDYEFTSIFGEDMDIIDFD